MLFEGLNLQLLLFASFYLFSFHFSIEFVGILSALYEAKTINITYSSIKTLHDYLLELSNPLEHRQISFVTQMHVVSDCVPRIEWMEAYHVESLVGQSASRMVFQYTVHIFYLKQRR